MGDCGASEQRLTIERVQVCTDDFDGDASGNDLNEDDLQALQALEGLVVNVCQWVKDDEFVGGGVQQFLFTTLDNTTALEAFNGDGCDVVVSLCMTEGSMSFTASLVRFGGAGEQVPAGLVIDLEEVPVAMRKRDVLSSS